MGKVCHLSVSGCRQGGQQTSEPPEWSLLQAPVQRSKEEGEKESCGQGKK